METLLKLIGAYLLIALAFGYIYRFFVHSRSARFKGNEMWPVFIAGLFWPGMLIFGLFVGASRALDAWYKNQIDQGAALSSLDDWMSWLFARKIHEDKFGKLYDMPSPYGRIRKVRVTDSTGVYWIAVPRDMSRAKQAVAWTYNIDEDLFNPVRV